MYYSIGVTLIIAGIILKIYFSKSSFERRNSAGIEEFSSYWIMKLIRLLEHLTTIAIIIGVFFILGGDSQ
ncbi:MULTISPECIES: hypothetical protein [unclassified Pseudoalteromonas]|uniref:hypothetical protein n=1 Tax=unclassified Pseudoalteromonas TaxID=194690 RepID=UPI000C346C84|nr:hypothetical protein [Pseudoalteromonas sp. 78C3]PKH89965.1 hypothetical protein CXF76_19385 [Pseudoalteromonas sp. 78C3]